MEQQATASAFQLVGPDKVDGKAATRIAYTLALGADGYASEEYRVTLWIDEKSALPLKREIRQPDPESAFTITERIVAKIVAVPDLKRFELPKEGRR